MGRGEKEVCPFPSGTCWTPELGLSACVCTVGAVPSARARRGPSASGARRQGQLGSDSHTCTQDYRVHKAPPLPSLSFRPQYSVLGRRAHLCCEYQACTVVRWCMTSAASRYDTGCLRIRIRHI